MILLLPTAVFAQGIRNSDHDLSNSSTAALKNANPANNEICIYCHTPHRAQSTQFLWNHSPTLTVAWNWGNDLDGNAMTKTTTGTNLPSTLRSGSKRCLGCHDGSVAIGDVSNAGDGVAGIIPGLASIVGLTDASGRLIDAAKLIGAGGNMGGNHPVSIPYAGETGYNGINSSVPAAWIGPAVVGGYYNVSVVGCTSPTGVCTTAPVTDGRNGAAVNLVPNLAGGTTNLGVECSSCHEPHNQYGFAYFTRIDVANASGLCRSCHNK
jgi:hypothetical protein